MAIKIAFVAAILRRTDTYVLPDRIEERLTSMSVSPISKAKMIR
jgi:hypothetical protein